MRVFITFTTFFAVFMIYGLAFAQGESAPTGVQFSFGDGSEAFKLKQSSVSEMGYDATLQMIGSNEVWVLNKAQGARGTVIYKNDTGRIFLRVNHIGGATLYPTPESMGIPVLRESEYRFEPKNAVSTDESKKAKSIEEWSRVYAYAGNKNPGVEKNKAFKAGQGNIKFADWPLSKKQYKTELISHLSDLVETRLGDDIERIIVKIGETPRAAQSESELTIWVNPTLGIAGRPSTEKILTQLDERQS